MFTGRQQKTGNRFHDRRLAAAAHHQVAHADDRPGEVAHAVGVPAVPGPARPRRAPVQAAEESQWAALNGLRGRDAPRIARDLPAARGRR
jgi:hypothetical protein